MCMFTGSVQKVAGTKIFARRSGAEQVLAYAMNVEAPQDLAMVLPLPVPPGSDERAVRFIDLSGYPRLFDDLERLFPRPASFGRGYGAPQAMLAVQDVGAFEASFVPTIADFARLDPRFRLPEPIWAQLPGYRDWGFAVFKLRASASGAVEKVHPMALRFPTREPAGLFFPTVHVHDGAVHPAARFDHDLYGQLERQPEPVEGSTWWEGPPVRTAVDIARAAGVVDPDLPLFKCRLTGLLANRDTHAR